MPDKIEADPGVTLGSVRKLIRHRCGPILPEDDAGFEYLVEMLKLISLGSHADRKMHNAVEVFAPFLSSHDAEQIIDNVNRMPVWQRWPKARVLGESLMLTNAEHETLQLRGIHPCDISDEDLAERRKARKRARRSHGSNSV